MVFYKRALTRGQPRNCALADIVAARDAALHLTGFEALAGLGLLFLCQFRFPTCAHP
jgi:hypothetical protein